LFSRVIETCSRTDTRLAGTRCKDPRRGEVLSGELLGPLRSRLRRADDGGTVRRPARFKLRGGGHRDERGRRRGRHPLEGEKPKGGSSLSAACSAGHGLPRRAKPGRRARTTPSVNGASARANARRARPAGRQADAAEGETFEGPESHERCRMKHDGEVSGGTRRQEGRNPEDAA
jgi:hypothetical protein